MNKTTIIIPIFRPGSLSSSFVKFTENYISQIQGSKIINSVKPSYLHGY